MAVDVHFFLYILNIPYFLKGSTLSFQNLQFSLIILPRPPYNRVREKIKTRKTWELDQMSGPQLNTPGIQLNIGSLDPAFFVGQPLILGPSI